MVLTVISRVIVSKLAAKILMVPVWVMGNVRKDGVEQHVIRVSFISFIGPSNIKAALLKTRIDVTVNCHIKDPTTLM